MRPGPAEIDYELITLEDGSFGVRITEADRLPRVVTGFDSQAEAETWIFRQVEAPSGPEGLPNRI